MLQAEQFYDDIAASYDAMTGFDTRLAAQKPLLQRLIDRLPAESVIDMGCGTGVHAIALAQMGLRATGVDISAGMLERAQRHAGQHSASVRFVHGDFLAPLTDPPADLLLCLGNSLPHLPSRAALAAVFAHWRSLLVPGGHVLVQLLNYRRVLTRKERIVNIRRDGERTIVRFYDFLDDGLQFNILTIDATASAASASAAGASAAGASATSASAAGASPKHRLQSTRLQPFTDTDLVEAAATAGLRETGVFGGLDFSSFHANSTDCVLIATL
ncbi:class I SAM-dependent methyltransferase [bacterium]|nr:class I SAM-dependent methyltransferase [bacterium]